MISVVKDFENPPNSLNSDKCNQAIAKCLLEKKDHTFTEDYKRKDITDTLTVIYNGKKCAYCEGKPSATSTIHVEHYRPKKKSRKKPPIHNGYYWLGYEWTNLLFACSKCNGRKSTKFPLDIAGVRIVSPSFQKNNLDLLKCRINYIDLLKEKPILLNPEIDHPEDHIVFLSSGEAWGVTPRGVKTISICKLNRYFLIVEGRKKLIDKYYIKIKEHIDNYSSALINEDTLDYCIKDVLADIWKLRLPENEYSRLGYFMFEKFDLFYARKFGEKNRRLLIEKYEAFKAEFGLFSQM